MMSKSDATGVRVWHWWQKQLPYFLGKLLEKENML